MTAGTITTTPGGYGFRSRSAVRSSARAVW